MNDPAMSLLFFIAEIIGFGLLGVWLLTIFVVVPEKTFKTTSWFGSKFMRILKPGLRIKLPYPFEIVDVSMSTKVQPIGVKVTSMTQDNAQISIQASVHYTPKEGSYYQAAYALENPEGQMATYLDNFLRAQVKTLDVQQVFSSTTEFQQDIMEKLSEKFGEYGYKIENVLVGEPILSEQMAKAYERKLIGEQEKQAAVAEGDALKTRLTMKAEAEGESLKIKAQAFKEFRKLIAEGNTEAIKTFLDDLHDGSLNAKSVLDFFSGLDEREAYRDAATHGGKSVFIGGGNGGNGGSLKQEVASAVTAALIAYENAPKGLIPVVPVAPAGVSPAA
ncbi:SPFH domain-containing protein [Agrobacterium salinitolerans]|nr:SPFH domain-containing protein [Agrobacterium salinitolerans]